MARRRGVLGRGLALWLASFFVEEVRVAPGVGLGNRSSVCDVAAALGAAFLYIAAAVQGVMLGGGPGRGCGAPGAVRFPGHAPAQGESEQGDGGSEMVPRTKACIWCLPLDDAGPPGGGPASEVVGGGCVGVGNWSRGSGSPGKSAWWASSGLFGVGFRVASITTSAGTGSYRAGVRRGG